MKTVTFENGDLKSATCKYKDASVDKNILLRFRRDENGYFCKHLISVNGA